MRYLLLFVFLWLGWNSSGAGQVVGPLPSPVESIKENSVSTMAALGDTLWIGPGLNRNISNSLEWYYPEGAAKITGGKGRVFSLALKQDTVWGGLGYNASTSDGSVQAGMGYHYSTDGGDSWEYLKNPNEESSDTTFIYGGTTYAKLPVTTREQAPPFDISLEDETVLSASWALGLVRSRDFGNSWERLILPPQSADRMVPENKYTFNGDGKNRYDPRFDQNLLGFSVMIDNRGAVWCGTAGGLNISENALTAPRSQIRWKHIQYADSSNGLLGNWITTIRRQLSTGDIWLTNWDSGLHENEQEGIVRTSDGGNSFDQYLIGERINDIGFKNGVIYAAGNNGLFMSSDNGDSWREIPQIRTADNFIKKSAEYYSVTATNERLWIGTSDGLASTADGGQNWTITRVNFPLDGSNRYQQNAPNVETYAYPNPFSPRRHNQVRIKYEIQKSGNVRVRLFDFGMNLIKEIESGQYSAGTYEAVWDGLDHDGNQVANGTVFYQIDAPDNTIRGKILVID